MFCLKTSIAKDFHSFKGTNENNSNSERKKIENKHIKIVGNNTITEHNTQPFPWLVWHKRNDNS